VDCAKRNPARRSALPSQRIKCAAEISEQHTSKTFRAGALLLIIPSQVGAPPNLTRRCSTGASRRFSWLSDLRCGPIDGARTVELCEATGSLRTPARALAAGTDVFHPVLLLLLL
jgi:hypothetical protein